MTGVIISIGLFFIVGIILLLTSLWNRRKHFEVKERSIPGHWIKSRVSPDQCELKSRDYYETPINDDIPSQIEMLDSLSPANNLIQYKRTVSVVIFKRKKGDVLYQYRSDPIYLSPEMVKFSFLNKTAEVTLYEDPNKPENYFLDVQV